MAESNRKYQSIYGSWHGLAKGAIGQARTAKTIEVIARKAEVEGTGLLRKTEMKNDMPQAKIC